MRSPSDPDPEALCFRWATGYLARRAASRLQLRTYLLRKLARTEATVERLDKSANAVVETVLERLGKLQLLDDTSLAQSRARTLAGKGFSVRRLRLHLSHQGFDTDDPALAPTIDVDDEVQALRYAQRKRLGPYATDRNRPAFERDMRALVRAGFPADVAKRVLLRLPDGPDVNDA